MIVKDDNNKRYMNPTSCKCKSQNTEFFPSCCSVHSENHIGEIYQGSINYQVNPTQNKATQTHNIPLESNKMEQKINSHIEKDPPKIPTKEEIYKSLNLIIPYYEDDDNPEHLISYMDTNNKHEISTINKSAVNSDKDKNYCYKTESTEKLIENPKYKNISTLNSTLNIKQELPYENLSTKKITKGYHKNCEHTKVSLSKELFDIQTYDEKYQFLKVEPISNHMKETAKNVIKLSSTNISNKENILPVRSSRSNISNNLKKFLHNTNERFFEDFHSTKYNRIFHDKHSTPKFQLKAKTANIDKNEENNDSKIACSSSKKIPPHKFIPVNEDKKKFALGSFDAQIFADNYFKYIPDNFLNFYCNNDCLCFEGSLCNLNIPTYSKEKKIISPSLNSSKLCLGEERISEVRQVGIPHENPEPYQNHVPIEKYFRDRKSIHLGIDIQESKFVKESTQHKKQNTLNNLNRAEREKPSKKAKSIQKKACQCCCSEMDELRRICIPTCTLDTFMKDGKYFENKYKEPLEREEIVSNNDNRLESQSKPLNGGANVTIQIFSNGYDPKINSEFPNNLNSSVFKGNDPIKKEVKLENSEENPHKIKTLQTTESIPYLKHSKVNQKNENKQANKWWSCNWFRKKHKNERQNARKIPNEHPYSTGDCREFEQINNTTNQDYPPISLLSNIYSKKDENLLKYLHNKRFVRDLFATPCSSFSTAFSSTRVNKIRDLPFSIKNSCPTQLCCSLKPVTAEKDAQCEMITNKAVTNHSSEKLNIENQIISSLNSRNNMPHFIPCKFHNNLCYCHSICNCCCNLQRTAYCCPKIDVIPRKVDKSKCTCCRSIQVKNPVKDCGTNISEDFLKTVRTISTNTELNSKLSLTDNTEERSHCCFRPLSCNCCWCNHHTPEPKITCCHCNYKIPCLGYEHICYSYRCDNISKSNNSDSLRECIYVAHNDNAFNHRRVILDSTDAKFDINSHDKKRDYQLNQNKDFVKNITLDLCNLGDKTFSNFVMPTQYHSLNSSFLTDTTKINFNRNDKACDLCLTEILSDPTPCLKPEIVSPIHSKFNSSNIENQENTYACVPFDDKKCINYEKQLTKISTYSFPEENNLQAEEYLKQVNHYLQILSDYNAYSDLNLNKKNNINLTSNNQISKIPAKNESLVRSHEDYQEKRDNMKQQFSAMTVNQIEIKSTNTKKTEKWDHENNITDAYKITDTKFHNCTNKPFTTKTGLMSFIPSFRSNFNNSPNQKPKSNLSKRTKLRLNTPNHPSSITNPLKCQDDYLLSSEQLKNKNMAKSNEQENKKTKNLKKNNDVENISENSYANIKNDTPSGTNSRDVFTSMSICEKIGDTFLAAHPNFCKKPKEMYNENISIPYFKSSVADIVKSLELRRTCNTDKSTPLVRCLLGSRKNCEEIQNKSVPEISPKNSRNDVTINKSHLNEFYTNVFRRSLNQNDQIPKRVMSKTDIVLLQ